MTFGTVTRQQTENAIIRDDLEELCITFDDLARGSELYGFEHEFDVVRANR